MSEAFKIFVVDDDPMLLDVMENILSPDYNISGFLSAEDCLAKLENEAPDLFLLDVSLPGINGYELCRLIKSHPTMKSVPVTFVSGHDTIEARLAGYDAGGEDFIVKPFASDEVLRKVRVGQQILQNQRALSEQIAAAEYLSSLVMAGMDEAGILLQFMSKLIAWEQPADIAAGVLELLQRYRLEGVVQLRTPHESHTYSLAGVDIPLESSIICHVQHQGRIFEFHNRSVHNFDRITLLIKNLPLDQPEYCGRLRDNLSIAAQGVDSRLKAIEISKTNQQQQVGIQHALASIASSIMQLRAQYQQDHTESVTLIQDFNDQLIQAFLSFGLHEQQEQFLQNMIADFMRSMSKLLERGTQTPETLQLISMELEKLRDR